MSAERLKPWGRAYQERTRRGTTDFDCCVCGKRVKDPVELYVIASPATGDFCGEDGEEASLYPIGSDCARRVRAERPDAILSAGPTETPKATEIE